MNALMMASGEGHYECVEFLVDYFKTANLLHEKTISGRNAFECAQHNQHEDVITLLEPYYEQNPSLEV